MRENDVKKCFLTVENFWEELPLPKGMSPVVKCNVRLNQLYFRAWKGGYEEDLDQRAAEIWGFSRRRAYVCANDCDSEHGGGKHKPDCFIGTI